MRERVLSERRGDRGCARASAEAGANEGVGPMKGMKLRVSGLRGNCGAVCGGLFRTSPLLVGPIAVLSGTATLRVSTGRELAA